MRLTRLPGACRYGLKKRDGRLLRGDAFTEAELATHWELAGCPGSMRATQKTAEELLAGLLDPGPCYISTDDCTLANDDARRSK